jgi:hypothetical protein
VIAKAQAYILQVDTHRRSTPWRRRLSGIGGALLVSIRVWEL